MATQRLYYEDAYLRRFEATVLSCEPAKKHFAVVLDRTAFFPEGGGQAPDLGTLDGIAVLDVQERGDEVVFRNLKPGTMVSLYDLRGQLLEQRKAESLNPLTISVQNRPGGVYIVKSDNETIKLLKR